MYIEEFVIVSAIIVFIAIYRNYKKTTLTLVTCTNNDSNSQTIYIAELQSVE